MMNEIHWQDKRTMDSRQYSPARGTPVRRAYDNIVSNPYSMATGRQRPTYLPHERVISSSYDQYSNAMSNRPSNHRATEFPSASSSHGVYRRSPPLFITTFAPSYRTETRRNEQRPLSRSASEDYYTNKYSSSIAFDDDDDDDEPEQHSTEVYHYISGNVIVSSHGQGCALPLQNNSIVRFIRESMSTQTNIVRLTWPRSIFCAKHVFTRLPMGIVLLILDCASWFK
jgi:hypothetical protein